MKDKKGFTLIELLAVIVILGILMLIAIPSVTKYINSSKKETYAKSLSSMVDVVRYGVISGSSEYSLGSEMEKTFSLKDIELEKGSNKSPYGDYIEESSYIKVVKNGDTYDYLVQVKDTGGYCIALTNINNLTKDDIKKCEEVNIPDITTYEAYSVGDQITFAGSNWYVIKNSTVEEDYVTLLKGMILTRSDLGGDYAYNTENAMLYYWDDYCNAGNGTACGGHSDYEGSKVKEFLEEVYINILGGDNLKEVDGYKIRLITRDELNLNLGWIRLANTAGGSGSTGGVVESWVFSAPIIGGAKYWTMNESSSNNMSVWTVSSVNGDTGGLMTSTVVYQSAGVRPVINLLKNSI